MTKQVFRGMDRAEMGIDVATTLFGLMFAAVFIWRYGYLYPWVALSLILLLALSFGARWKVTISPGGVTLERWRFWVIPRPTKHFLLDMSFGHYWPFESARPEGISIDDYSVYNHDLCFGPRGSAALDDLLESLNQSLTRARQALSDAEQSEQAKPAFPFDEHDFDWNTAEWSTTKSGPGRLKKIRSTAKILVSENLEIPGDSVFEFNQLLSQQNTAWMDPRRPDILDAITLSAPVQIPDLQPPAAPGTILRFSHGELMSVEDGEDQVFTWGTYQLDGGEPIKFRDGRPSGFKLAGSLEISGHTIAAGSYMERYFIGDWRFELSEAVTLPQFTLEAGEHLHWNDRRLTHATLNRDLPLGKKNIKARSLIFLKSNGRVDLRACKKAGVLS